MKKDLNLGTHASFIELKRIINIQKESGEALIKFKSGLIASIAAMDRCSTYFCKWNKSSRKNNE